MGGQIILDPLLAWPLVAAAAGLAVLLVGLAAWRRLAGWWLRALAAAAVLAAVANPSVQDEERTALPDTVLVVADTSASQRIADRPAQAEAAVAGVAARLAALPGTEMRLVPLGDAPDNGGTLAMTALAGALAEVPRGQVAGAIVISDGQVHDAAAAPEIGAPLHLLMTGRAEDWDRRLIVRNAPAFAILGEPVTLTLRIEDEGRVPAAAAGQAVIAIGVGGAAPTTVRVPTGADLELPVTLEHGGLNVLRFEVAAAEGELTDRNNAAIVQINGVRDRLRVLLVSGEPHAGERVWRNLLKADAAVDLVHFTILRPPEKQDGVPVTELSLIAFPTRELFVEKIDEFDLIIFDRYRRRGILPAAYFDNIRRYVLQGGAVLVAAGPEYGSADSLYHSGLAEVLPGTPTARVLDEGFRPAVTGLGARHPVTEGLGAGLPEVEGAPGWGRWFRLVEVGADRGQVVMAGPGARPLLILDRAGAGRVALLASDHAWLWSRGYEGGGPQLELLRRLAHWMMREPELEEEALTATAEGLRLTVTRRTLAEGAREVTLTAPDGSVTVLPMEEVAPGRHQAEWLAPDVGLYRLSDGEMETVAALGPAAPREFEATIASAAPLAAVLAAGGGAAARIEDGLPEIRRVRAGRPAAGRGWIGITPRGAYVTTDLRIAALLPPWAFLALAALLAVAAWLREGRR